MAVLNVGSNIAYQPVAIGLPATQPPVVASGVKGTILSITPIQGGPYRVEVQLNSYVPNLGVGAMQKPGSRQQILLFDTDSLAIFVGAVVTLDIEKSGDFVVPVNITFP